MCNGGVTVHSIGYAIAIWLCLNSRPRSMVMGEEKERRARREG